MTEYKTFAHAYKDIIKKIESQGRSKTSRIGRARELKNLVYTIDSPASVIDLEQQFDFYPRKLKVPNFEYGRAFAEWVISGQSFMPQSLKDLNPIAARYDANQSDLSTFELPANFSAFYGPRVAEQLQSVIDEIRLSPDTRRAYISILDGINDNKLLEPLRNGQLPTVEYPCTIGFQFTVNESVVNTIHELDLTVHMRSQNMISVWPYDYMIAQKLLQLVCGELNYEPGTITGMITSAHIYARDYEYANSIINAFKD